MTLTTADVRDYVNAGDEHETFLGTCLVEAIALVAKDVGTTLVPQAIQDRAVLECVSELFQRRNAPNGIAAYNEFNGAPVRISRDPMIGARAILAPWVVYGL